MPASETTGKYGYITTSTHSAEPMKQCFKKSLSSDMLICLLFTKTKARTLLERESVREVVEGGRVVGREDRSQTLNTKYSYSQNVCLLYNFVSLDKQETRRPVSVPTEPLSNAHSHRYPARTQIQRHIHRYTDTQILG